MLGLVGRLKCVSCLFGVLMLSCYWMVMFCGCGVGVKLSLFSC